MVESAKNKSIEEDLKGPGILRNSMKNNNGKILLIIYKRLTIQFKMLQ